MPDRTQFHSVEINGLTFNAFMSGDGPILSAARKREDHGWVHLGSVAEICHISEPSLHHDRRQGWCICKYGPNEPRIELTNFTEGDAFIIAQTFGLEAWELGIEESDFYDSPAWTSLKAWVAKHPRIAADYADCQNYLPRWYDHALEENASALASTDRKPS